MKPLRNTLAALTLALFIAPPAMAQSVACPVIPATGLTTWTIPQWNACLQSLQPLIGYTTLNQSLNLADVGSVSASRTNLGIGTLAQSFPASGISLLGSSTGFTTFASANTGTSNYTLTFPAATGTLALTSGSVGTATNLAGGAANSIPYQSGAGATTFLTQGTGVLQEQAGAPVWTQAPLFTTQGYWDSSTKAANTAMVQAAIQFSMSTLPLAITGGTYSFAGTGSGAVFTFTATGGAITSITLIPVPGSGYKVGDLLSVPLANHDAVLQVASLSGSGIASMNVIYGGTGYTSSGSQPTNAVASTPFTFILSGVLTSNVTIIVTPGTYNTQPNQWIVANNTTGAHTVTVQMGTGSDTATGTGVVVPQGTANSAPAFIWTDGETDVWCVSCFGTAAGTYAQGNDARLGAGAITGAIKSNGSNSFAQAACADLSNAAAGCSAGAATSSVLGLVKPDGTTLTNSSGAISVAYGTASNTAAQGNDSRITGAAPKASPTFTGTVTLPDTGTLTSSANTFVAPVKTPASVTGGAGLNIAPGTAPTSPNNGDCWVTSAGLYCRINGATVGPYISLGTAGNCAGQAAREVTAAGSVTITTADCNVDIDKTTGAATAVALPATPPAGTTFTIADGKGDSQANPITISPAAGTISGRSTYVLSTPGYPSVTVWYTGTQWLVR